MPSLTPRQGITAAPYALTAGRAQTVDTGSISNPSFLGTTSGAPLDFSVNNQRGLRLQYAATGDGPSPNLIGGFSGNVVSNGFSGAVIGGGGAVGFENRVGRDYATVVGGLDNTAIGYASTAMGQHSIASGEASTAMGRDTKASGEWATAFGLQTHAIGSGSTAGGVLSKASGYASVALGYNAHSTFDGSFVWADHTDGPFASSNGNQFLIRADERAGERRMSIVEGVTKADEPRIDFIGDFADSRFAWLKTAGRLAPQVPTKAESAANLPAAGAGSVVPAALALAVKPRCRPAAPSPK